MFSKSKERQVVFVKIDSLFHSSCFKILSNTFRAKWYNMNISGIVNVSASKLNKNNMHTKIVSLYVQIA